MPQHDPNALQQGIVYQYSTGHAITHGRLYDGEVTVSHLIQHGNFGIGSFNGLDGEMILLDGIVYQVKGDGTVQKAPSSAYIPIGTATYFSPNQTYFFDQSMSLTELKEQINPLLTNQHILYAIKIQGQFKNAKAKSGFKLTKPYPSLAEIFDSLPEFKFNDFTGTLVGFWSPEHMDHINMPGYHLHLLTSDLQGGGHLLDCQIIEAKVEIQKLHQLKLELPQNHTYS